MSAISLVTFLPMSWPPSPGLAPWAILICSSSAFIKYSASTPNRPDATWRMRLRNRLLRGSPFRHSSSSRAARSLGGGVAEGHAHLGVEGVVVAVAPQKLHLLGALQPPFGVLDHFLEPDAADARREIAEEFHQFRPEADGLEEHGPAVALDGGD